MDLRSTNTEKVPKIIRESARFENEHDDEDRINTVLENSGYTVKEQIGAGAFSSVLKAFSKHHNADVAVKVISKLRASKQVLTKFLPREIELVKTLKHPNLMRYHECIETSLRYYIVMQYAVNGSLLSLLRFQKRLPEVVAKRFFNQLIDAVEYIHNIGIVHRDIKCENIVFDELNTLKLIDFGFARGNMLPINVGSKIKPVLSKTFCGSHAYASPEILRCQLYQPQLSDIWAAGVVLYTMVFGYLPFSNVKNVTVLLKQIDIGPIFARHRMVTNAFKDVVRKIMQPAALRISIKELRKLPWMKEEEDDSDNGETAHERQIDSEVVNSSSADTNITPSSTRHSNKDDKSVKTNRCNKSEVTTSSRASKRKRTAVK